LLGFEYSHFRGAVDPMNAKVFAEWFSRRGYRTISTSTTYWFEVAPHIYQAIPYQWLTDPSDADIHEFHLSQFSRSTRYDVRKGLRYAGVEPISLSCLASQGWTLRQETIARQERSDAETAAWWQSLCASAEGLPGFEAWGAVRSGTLMACILTFTMEGWCIGLYQQCCAEALRTCVNNALTYSFTKEALSRPDIHQVFYGLHSLDADENLDTFKFRMGYTAKPVRQRVVLHPWMRCLVNPVGHRILKTVRKWRPSRSSLAKAEGMVRFYLEGKKPLARQVCPECLAGYQVDLLGH
jgi:hypothetical protein